ncbi:MAG: lipopolysaccharide transport periplasmic protein LptA [Methylococcales bacterium]
MKQINKYCLILLLGFYSAVAFALDSDKDQPINIDSNTATYDDAAATSIYTGKVVSIQGSLRVESDKLVVYFKDGEAEKLVFTGKRAKFRQTPKEGDEDITGEALTGEYYPKKNLLVLIDEATVWQGNGTYSSKLIEYDSRNSVVKAGETASDDKRVHVTLQPKSKEKKTQ